MIVGKVYNQLGNQMVMYSAVKSICLDNGLTFKFYVEKIKNEKEINDRGARYGREIYTIFEELKKELVTEAEFDKIEFDYIIEYTEAFSFLRTVNKDANILVEHAWSSSVRLFQNRLAEFHDWFKFPDNILKSCTAIVNKERLSKEILISVHFRCGIDYLKGAYQLNYKYWIECGKYLKEKYTGRKIKFFLFYDTGNCFAVHRFKRKFKGMCYEYGEELAHDMCLMSLCDSHIVCNSTFSVVSALLDSDISHIVVRPMNAPCGTGYMKEELFPNTPNWIVIGKGRRSIGAFIFRGIRILHGRLVKRKGL